MRHAKLVAAAALFCVFFAGPARAKKNKDNQPVSWLDAATPKDWNKPGRPIPHAPRGSAVEERCGHRYPAQSPGEKAVAQAGWTLMSKSISHNEIAVVGAQASNDGMCRPNEYQYFVFVGGNLAGTLSPVLMNARSDASVSNVAVPGDGRIVVEYSRYADRDALCCPSRISEIEFEPSGTHGKSALVIKKINVRRTQ